MVRLIAAIDTKRGIARGGIIPWDLPRDKVHFRELGLAEGVNVLMGRNIYEALGYIEGRNYYIASHHELDLPKGCTLVNDLTKFLSDFKDDLWVIGGEAIYNETIKLADELYLTTIEADFNCDQFFPDYSNFKLTNSEGPFKESDLTFSFKLFSR